MTLTTTHEFELPTEGGNLRTWGQILNDNWSKLDGILLSQAQIIDLIYPIGSVMVRNDTQDPNTFLPGTTWVKTSEGRAIVGVGNADGVNRSLYDTYGANNKSLQASELPSHSHNSGNLVTSNNGGHSHNSGNLSTNSVGNHNHGSGNLFTNNTGGHRHIVRYARSNNSARNENFQSLINIVNTTDGNGNVNDRETQTAGSHSHNIGGSTAGAGAHSHNIGGNTSNTGAHSHNIGGSTGSVGSGQSFSLSQPSQAFNVWERTA